MRRRASSRCSAALPSSAAAMAWPVAASARAPPAWTVGRNLSIDYRWGVSDLGKARFWQSDRSCV